MAAIGSRLLRSRRVQRLRDLARHDTAARESLARELILLWKESLERGRTGLALTTAEELVAINRARAVDSTRDSRIALAEALQALALTLCEQQRFEEGEPVVAESVALVRELRVEQSDKQLESMLRTGMYLLTACAADDAVIGEGTTPIGDGQSEPT